MEELKNNSDAFREKSSLDQPIREDTKPAVRKIEDGKVVKKKTGLKELTNGFIQEDASVVKTYLWKDVLKPALIKTLYDLGIGALGMFLYGENSAPTKTKSKTDDASWRKYYKAQTFRDISEESMRSDPIYSEGEAVYSTQEKATEAYHALAEALDIYKSISVANLYSTVGVTPDYTDYKWGWYSMAGAKIFPSEAGWVLRMPKAVPLDK